MRKSVIFPVRHIEGNLVFTNNDQVWAYYEVPKVNYTYRSPSEKKQLRQSWMHVLRKFENDMHLLMIPRFFDIEAHQEKLKKDVPEGAMTKQGIHYIDEMTKVLVKKQKRPTDQRIFIGLRLNRTKAHSTRRQLKKQLRFQFKDLRRLIYYTAGIEPYDILDEELTAYQDREIQIYQDLYGCLPVQRVTVHDLQVLIQHSAFRGIGEPRGSNSWKPRAEAFEMNGHEVIRPNQKDIELLMNGEYEVSSHHVKVKQFHEGEIKEGWMQFLYLSYMPDDLIFPGEEWAYWLQSLPFPVDLSIRIKVIPHQQATELLGRQKRRLSHHITHTREDGQQQDLDLEETYLEAVEQEKNLKQTKEPILQMTACFCVYADSERKMMERTQTLIRHYENRNHDMKLLVSPGDQFLAFHEFLPGGTQFVKDFNQKLKPEMVATAMINGSQHLGDARGMFIGYTGPAEMPAKYLDRPVFLHQALAAQGGETLDTKSLSTLIVGRTGFGKSFGAALLSYQAMHHLGAKVLLIDSKGERGNWVEDLPGCKGQVALIRLGSDPRYRGMLDPFMIFPREEAPLFAKDFLMQLVQVDRTHDWHHLIQEAIQEVKMSDRPSMSGVLNLIKQKDERLYRSLALYESFPFSQLIFGDGNPSEHQLSLDKALNIIQIDELRIPDRTKDPKQYDELEILSKALMLPITGFVNQLVKRDRHRFKQIWWEEAWIPLASDLGQRAVDEGIRMGRYWNAGTLLVTQNPSDVPDQLINNIGVKLVFKTVDEDEVTQALEILQIENNEANRQAVQGLKEGECFMRDIYGRVGRVYLDCLFGNLAKAFDTTPPLEQERVVG
ncbi:AAA domain-containing protein [Laceyella sacchari]|uniref:ATP-binding protein n=1 Tax=Laceyella sacchari TaxID=37482 RepID=UPI0010494888|nr:ATP-binding protein [Laceyella sacchari]TCW41596.1 AAA domain-containing protein [Laceyella sacchari]